MIALLISAAMGVLVFLCSFTAHNFAKPHSFYQIYLDGETIGVIDNEDTLYNLIDEDQSGIKDEYGINRVYPPKGFEVAKLLTYDDTLSNVNDVYSKIKEERDFTIKGYTITINYTSEDEEQNKVYTINVLDKQVFEDALKNLVTSFISAEQYQNYINNTQPEIVDTGKMIENMYFQDNISVKEGYISTKDKIYTDVQELSQFLLFGPDMEAKYYEVKAGDTIDSIAENNKMSTQELLIANPSLTGSNDLLAIGEKLNIALINPQLHFVYYLIETEDFEDKYETKVKYDYSKPNSYKLVETRGVTGLIRATTRTEVINGATSSEAEYIGEPITIREKQDEVIVRGSVSYIQPNDNGIYFDDGTTWAWPTNSPYKITSPFGWRGGVMHDGTDISGTGAGSPIYAIADGIVRNAGWGGMPGNSAGYNVVIEHPNGYWSIYAHMIGMPNVSVGQAVTRKQRIGSMGETGEAYGVHLHLSVSIGKPWSAGYKFINPLVLWQ